MKTTGADPDVSRIASFECDALKGRTCLTWRKGRLKGSLDLVGGEDEEGMSFF